MDATDTTTVKGWTTDRIEQLKSLHGQGLSCSQIANSMGGWGDSPDNGRNAVIGKLRRLGITGGGEKKVTTKQVKAKEPKEATPARTTPFNPASATSNLPAVRRRADSSIRTKAIPKPGGTVMIRPAEHYPYGHQHSPFPEASMDPSDPLHATKADIEAIERFLYNPA